MSSRSRADPVAVCAPVPDVWVVVAEMPGAYLQLCQARIEPLSLLRFGKIGASVWRCQKINGKVWYMDVALVPSRYRFGLMSIPELRRPHGRPH
jgi:hypothetical protein